MPLAPTILPLLAPAAAVLVAAGLLVYALRGRRIDDHPVCRKCGFDLFGKPEGSTVCSECGADLAGKRAVRVGNRRRRSRVLAAAAPMLLLSAGWLGAGAWTRVKATDW